MKSSPQTAIRGVASVAIINILARVIGYGKHVVITAYIGLTGQLDAYFVALTILSIFILTFGDVFDSLGIPRLVKTLQEKGEEEFRRLAGTVLILALGMSICLCILLAIVSPWTPWIAPGFTPDKKAYVLKNLLYLSPMALLYLPYHAFGSILRARRRFKDFYLLELLNTIAVVAVLYAGRTHPFIVPVAASAGCTLAFVCIAVVVRGEVSLSEGIDRGKIVELSRLLLALLPLYLSSYLIPLVDRAFASFLPTGAVSALSYGILIALIPSSILMMENVFVTPLSEDVNRETLMTEILCGVLMISIPLATFLCGYSDLIVRALLERGAFTRSSSIMTAEALTYFAAAIPAFLFWPICYRLFQILEKLKTIGFITAVGIAVNIVLNVVFLKLRMGVKGLALASAIASYISLAGGILLLARHGIAVVSRRTIPVVAITCAVSASAFALSRLVVSDPGNVFVLIPKGVLFVLFVAGMYLILPNEDIRHWRVTVWNEILPRRDKP